MPLFMCYRNDPRPEPTTVYQAVVRAFNKSEAQALLFQEDRAWGDDKYAHFDEIPIDGETEIIHSTLFPEMSEEMATILIKRELEAETVVCSDWNQVRDTPLSDFKKVVLRHRIHRT